MRRGFCEVCLCVVLSSGGCSDRDQSKKPEVVRPVLSIFAEPRAANSLGYAGIVEARNSADLSFRLLGRLATRPVNAGDTVEKGATIATLDQTASMLAVQSAKADYASALAQLTSASANNERLKKLLSSASISQAAYEGAQQANLTAKANADRAKAQLSKAEEQLSYTNLASDFDGVVTAVKADVGQTVSPGQTIVSVSRADSRDAVVNIPDYLIAGFRVGDPFEVGLQSLPSVRATGILREMAPQSDNATRTRRVLITLENAPKAFRLGSTVSAIPHTISDTAIELPISALLEKDGAQLVWTVDPTSLTVGLNKVTVLRRTDTVFTIGSGVEKGARIVIAGVHSLRIGQKVTLDDGAFK